MKTNRLFLGLVSFALFSLTAAADSHHWAGGGGNPYWTNANNWTGGGYPTETDTVYIRTNNSAGSPVLVPAGAEYTCGALRLGDNANTAGYLNVSAHLGTHAVYLGDDGGVGVMKVLSGGIHIPDFGAADYDIYVGYGGSGVSTYTVDGGELHLWEYNRVRVGYATGGGRGRLEYFTDTIFFHDPSQNEIILNTSDTSTLALGFNFDIPTLLAQPWLTINNSFTLEVTRNATATNNSGNNGVNVMQLGSATGAGTLNMSGGTWAPYDLYVGAANLGTVNHTGGTLNNGHLYLTYGWYSLSGSGALNASRTYIGNYGTASFTQSGGTHSYDAYMIIGSATGGNGTYTITGGSLSGGSLQLGVTAPGRFEWFRGGGIHFSAVEFGSSGTLAMGTNFNVGDLASGALYTGTAPTGFDLLQLEVTRGATATNSSGTATLGALRLGGAAGAGTLIVTGGVFGVKGDITDGGSASTLTLDGGTLDLRPSGDASPAGSIGSAGAPIDTLNFRSGTLKNVAEINGGEAFQKSGSGTLVLDGTNAYSGATTISAGTLRLGRAEVIPSGTGKGNVSVIGTLDLNSFNQTVNGLSGGGTVDSIAGGSPTFTVGSNSTGGTFIGFITNTAGTLSLRKVGTGTQALAGANAYVGTTIIENGAMQLLNDANRLPVTTVVTLGNLANSGKLILGDSFVPSDQTLAGLAISGTGTSNRVVGSHTSPSTLTLNVPGGSSTFNGFLGGPGLNEDRLVLAKEGAGTLILTASNSYLGATFITNGALALGHACALGSTNAGTTVLNGGRLELQTSGLFPPETLTLHGDGGGSGALRSAAGNNTWSGPITLGSDSAIGVAAGTSLRLMGVVDGGNELTKLGEGRLTLTEENAYDSGTLVEAGTLEVANASGSATGSGSVNVAASATLTGRGAVAGTVALSGIIAPGSSVGTLTTGAETWNPGGSYTWEINDAIGSPGAHPGWDLLSVDGSLDIQATPASRFTIKLVSLGGIVPGYAKHFDNRSNQTWLIASASGGVANFNSNKFVVDTLSFLNDTAGGAFLVETGSIALRFIPNQAPQASNIVAGRRAGAPLRLAIADLLARATSDPDGDDRALYTVSPISTNGGTVVFDTEFITYTPTNDAPDAFTYTVRDLRSSYRPQDTPLRSTATIHVTVNTNHFLKFVGIETLGDGNKRVTFAGIPSMTYLVQAATNLVGPILWETLSIKKAGTNGLWIFTDWHATNYPQRYYRSSQP